MSASASLAFPGGRTLAAWRRQLGGHHPQSLWVGYLTFHRVEAPVVVLRPRHLPPLERLTLKALAALAPATAVDLAAWLHLDVAWIGRVLQHLVAEGLVSWIDNKLAMVSDSGRGAVAHGEHLKPTRQRRSLHFWHIDWIPQAVARFVHLAHAERIAWLPAPDVPFEIDDLRKCVSQDPQWKRQHSFPGEIRELVMPSTDAQMPAWDDVIVATPQRCFAALVRTVTNAGPMLMGFSVNSRNWELSAGQPAFTMPDEQDNWLPPPVTQQSLTHAFAEWCQQRECHAESCELRVESERLIVTGTGSWRDKLHGESWLVVGEGALRTALTLELG